MNTNSYSYLMLQRAICHALLLFALTVSLMSTGCSEGRSGAANSTAPPDSALDKMELVFQGGHSKERIKSKLDQAFRLYGVPINEDNYNRYGSVLVRLRKEIGGATEMEILDHTIRSHVSGVSVKLEEMMALSVVAIKSGDR